MFSSPDLYFFPPFLVSFLSFWRKSAGEGEEKKSSFHRWKALFGIETKDFPFVLGIMRVVVCLLSCFHSLFTYTVGGSRSIHYTWAFFWFLGERKRKEKSSLLYHNLFNLSSFKTLVAGWPVCLQCFSTLPGLDRLAC